MRPFVRVIAVAGDGAQVFPAPGRKVIKAADYQAFVEARELRETARREADAILTEARREAAAILADARVRRDEEKARGHAEGLAEAEAEAAERRLLLAFEITDHLEAFEETAIDLVLVGVRKVLGSFDDRALVGRIVAAALAVVRDQRQVALRVCPAELEGVREQLDGMLSAYPGIRRVDLVADGRLKPGGCILESELGIVDASLEVQLANLAGALSRHLGDGRVGRRGADGPS